MVAVSDTEYDATTSSGRYNYVPSYSELRLIAEWCLGGEMLPWRLLLPLLLAQALAVKQLLKMVAVRILPVITRRWMPCFDSMDLKALRRVLLPAMLTIIRIAIARQPRCWQLLSPARCSCSAPLLPSASAAS